MATVYNVPASGALETLPGIGQQELEKIDAYLAGATPADQIEPPTVATATDVLEDVVTKILDAYVAEGVLTKGTVIQCSAPHCRATAPTDEVKQARADGDRYECPGVCEGDLVADAEATELTAYTPVDVLPRRQ